MKYKVINAIRTGTFQSKFGEMVKYAVTLEGEADAVELVQKPETPVPSGEIEGAIEVGQYGRKFKKEQVAGGFKGGFQKSQSDPASYIVSYAKDIVVALINNQDEKTKLTTENIKDDLCTLSVHLMSIYNSLKDNKEEVKTTTPATQTTVSANSDTPPMPSDDEISQEELNNLPF